MRASLIWPLSTQRLIDLAVVANVVVSDPMKGLTL